jgi:transcriptional regulator with XRE-family HTH domain
MNFPAKLSLLCWQKGWTQRELAEALGDVSKSTVGNWMSGKTDPRLRDLARLARLFEVSVDYLVLDERETPGGNGLSESQRRVLWAAETVGWEVALRRIMNAPPGEPDTQTRG